MESQHESGHSSQKTVRRSTCAVLVFAALMVGMFAGNAVTLIMQANRHQQSAPPTSAPADMPQTRPDPTQARLESTAAAHPDDPGAWARLGHYYFDNNMPAKAVGTYEKALALDPGNANLWSDLGVMYRRTGQFAKAVQSFEKATALDPAHMTARFNKGIVLLHDLNRKQEALAVWEGILKQNPKATTPGGQPLSDLVREVRGQ